MYDNYKFKIINMYAKKHKDLNKKILNNLIGTTLFKKNEVETKDKKSTRKKKCRSFKTNKKNKIKASGQ